MGETSVGCQKVCSLIRLWSVVLQGGAQRRGLKRRTLTYFAAWLTMLHQ